MSKAPVPSSSDSPPWALNIRAPIKTVSTPMSSSEALRIKYSDPVDPWEMLKTPWGEMPAWKAATLATGTTEAAMRAYEQVRNNSAGIVARHDAREAALNSHEDSIAARERQHAVKVADFVQFIGGAAKLLDRLEAAKARADQAKETQEPLNILPREWSQEPEPSLALEDTAPGEPSEAPEKKDQDPTGEVPEFRMPVAAGLDNEGD